MPTTWPPPRHEAPAAAPPAPVPSRRVALRRAVGRYVRARWGDLWGGSHAPLEDWNRLTRGLEAVIGIAPRVGSTPPSPTGDAAVARPWGGSAARFRQEYEADAVPARAFFAGAIVSVLIAGDHLVHGHRSSVLTSLGMAFVLAGVALRPAYRCWRLRTRDPGPARAFLRHPDAWWPDPLPPDQQP